MAGTEVVSCRDLQGRKMSDVLGALEGAFSSARCVCAVQLLAACGPVFWGLAWLAWHEQETWGNELVASLGERLAQNLLILWNM